MSYQRINGLSLSAISAPKVPALAGSGSSAATTALREMLDFKKDYCIVS
jgi:hypothetical protein